MSAIITGTCLKRKSSLCWFEVLAKPYCTSDVRAMPYAGPSNKAYNDRLSCHKILRPSSSNDDKELSNASA